MIPSRIPSTRHATSRRPKLARGPDGAGRRHGEAASGGGGGAAFLSSGPFRRESHQTSRTGRARRPTSPRARRGSRRRAGRTARRRRAARGRGRRAPPRRDSPRTAAPTSSRTVGLDARRHAAQRARHTGQRPQRTGDARMSREQRQRDRSGQHDRRGRPQVRGSRAVIRTVCERTSASEGYAARIRLRPGCGARASPQQRREERLAAQVVGRAADFRAEPLGERLRDARCGHERSICRRRSM